MISRAVDGIVQIADEQQMVQPQPGFALPLHALVVPEPIDAFVRMKMPRHMRQFNGHVGTQTYWAGGRALGSSRALQKAIGVPTGLRDAGISKDLFPAIVEHVLHDHSLRFNPRETSSEAPVREVLEAAW